jgi:hypothetical protein
MKKHWTAYHKTEAKSHESSQSWKDCKLQTYFTVKGRIDYFVVVDREKGGVKEIAGASMSLLTDLFI